MTRGGTLQQGIRRWWDGAGGRTGSAIRTLASPLEWAYREAVVRRNRRFDRGGTRRIEGLRIVSVGNLVVGGTGKTPFAAWTARVLSGSGARVALLTGSHGRDEVLLHLHWNPHIPAIASRSRAEGARIAREGGADVVVLDDGFQHRSLARDLDLVLLAAEDPFPGRLLPRGPYREPIGSLARAHAVVVTRRARSADRAGELEAEVTRRFSHLTLARLALVACGWQDLRGRPAPAPEGPALAVTAVARPESFAAQAASEAGRPMELMSFPDHRDFDARDAGAMRRRAGERTVVVSEKDAVKLRAFEAILEPVRVLAQSLRWEAGENALTNLITAGRVA